MGVRQQHGREEGMPMPHTHAMPCHGGKGVKTTQLLGGREREGEEGKVGYR